MLRSVQALRAIAALLVVFHHILPDFLIGAAGVDVFFVISGFIMGTVGLRETPGTFLRNRLIRVIPLYWGVTLTMAAASLIPGLFSHLHCNATQLLESLLFIPYWDPNGDLHPVVVVGWTLNYEMLFYVIFALGLMTARPMTWVSAAIIALVIVGYLSQPHFAPFALWTSPLLLEFVAGLLLSVTYARVGARAGAVAMILGISVLAVAQIYKAGDDEYRILLWGLPAMLLFVGVVSIEHHGRWPSAARPLEAVGDASYSLYLLHGIVISVVHKLLPVGLVSNVVIVPAAIALALMSFRYFERPLARYLRRLASPIAVESRATAS